MNFDAHQDKAADFSVYPWITKNLDRPAGEASSTLQPKKEVFYLLSCKAKRLAVLAATRTDLQDGARYEFKSTLPSTENEDAVLIVAFASGGKIHFQAASCSYSIYTDGHVYTGPIRMLRFQSAHLTNAPFLDQCAAIIPREFEFDIFRTALGGSGGHEGVGAKMGPS